MKSLRSKHWGKKKKWDLMKSRRKFDDDDDGGGGGGGGVKNLTEWGFFVVS
jgi:hypothetical protein